MAAAAATSSFKTQITVLIAEKGKKGEVADHLLPTLFFKAGNCHHSRRLEQGEEPYPLLDNAQLESHLMCGPNLLPEEGG